jgi:hypothetical protein
LGGESAIDFIDWSILTESQSLLFSAIHEDVSRSVDGLSNAFSGDVLQQFLLFKPCEMKL